MNSQLIIRNATPDDATEMVALIHSAIDHFLTGYHSVEEKEAWKEEFPLTATFVGRLKKCHILVAMLSSEIVGYAQCSLSEPQFQGVLTKPGFERRGIGGELMKAMEEFATKKGWRELYFTASLNAVAFYEKHGYVIVGPKTQHLFRTGVPIDCIPMRKKLDSNQSAHTTPASAPR